MSSQVAAVVGAAFSEHRLDAAVTKFATRQLRVVSSVLLNLHTTLARTTVLSGHGGVASTSGSSCVTS
jgi:hypothetical protein